MDLHDHLLHGHLGRPQLADGLRAAEPAGCHNGQDLHCAWDLLVFFFFGGGTHRHTGLVLRIGAGSKLVASNRADSSFCRVLT